MIGEDTILDLFSVFCLCPKAARWPQNDSDTFWMIMAGVDCIHPHHDHHRILMILLDTLLSITPKLPDFKYRVRDKMGSNEITPQTVMNTGVPGILTPGQKQKEA